MANYKYPKNMYKNWSSGNYTVYPETDMTGMSNMTFTNPAVAGAMSPMAKQNLLQQLWAKISNNQPLTNKVNLPNLGTAASKLRAWEPMGGGISVQNIANTAGGIYQGGKALTNLIDINATGDDLDNLRSDIISSAYNNPLANDYLNADQKKTLRQLKNGSYESQAASNAIGAGFGGALKSIPKALLAAGLGYITGNVPGALIQGIGTLTNSGLEAANTNKQQKNSQLQSLYEVLSNAESDYNSMRRPTNLRRAGLSQRAYSGLY